MKRIMLQTVCILCTVIMLFLAGCSPQFVIRFHDDIDTNPEFISFFSSDNYGGNAVAKYWSEHFVQQYNKKVYIRYADAKYYAEANLSYREMLQKRMSSSSPDDLYIISAEDVHEFERSGYLMDMSDMDFVDNLSHSARYQSTYKGKVFSVPLSITGFGFAWNVDLLAKYGLTIPNNLGQFWKVCETLHNAGITPYGGNKGYGLTVPAMCVGLASLYSAADRDQRLNELNAGTTRISDYLRKGYQFLYDMMSYGYLDAQQAMSTIPREGDVQLFQSGQCAFICIGLGEVPRINPNFEWQLTGLPVLDSGSVAVYGATHRLAANPESRHIDTVRRFIEMVGTTEALEISSSLDGTMSSAANGSTGVSDSEQSFAELLRSEGQIPNQDFTLLFNTWDSIRDCARLICEGTTVEDACKKLDELQLENLKLRG